MFPGKSLSFLPPISRFQDRVAILEADDGRFTFTADDRGTDVEVEVRYPAIGHSSPVFAGQEVDVFWNESEIDFFSLRDLDDVILFQGGDSVLNGAPATAESAFHFDEGSKELLCGRSCEGQYRAAAVEFRTDAGPVVLADGQQQDIRFDGGLYHAETFFAFDIVLPQGSIDGLEVGMEAMMVRIGP